MPTDDPLQLKSYGYQFHPDRIAQEPATERTDSRLLVNLPDGTINHDIFANLAAHIPENALVILNDTRVFPARILTQKPTGGKMELFLLECLDSSAQQSSWKVLAKPYKYFNNHDSLNLGDELSFKRTALEGDGDDTSFIIGDFNLNKEKLINWLDTHGSIPLPPYITREQAPTAKGTDSARYQTTYANLQGSVAAPTAGLHFDAATFSQLRNKGVEIAYCTLHVGGGTFLPIKSADISKHKMHSEWFYVASATLATLRQAKKEGRPIIGVGTTTFRALESLALLAKRRSQDLAALCDTWLQTDLYIYPTQDQPRFKSEFFNGIITNFHQPESSLLVLITALIGHLRVGQVYQTALDKEYRLFSYGDSSLLWF